jgi:saccharopine dehydrogenase-like NADP-dependent oxidoreductase
LPLAQSKTENHPNATIALDIFDANQRSDRKADIVISMLPAHLHIEVARDCVVYKRAPRLMLARCKSSTSCKENNLIFMNEIGLDPGDHMSAMKVIDEIEKGGKML